MNAAYLLAAITSVFFGAADLCGGIAARRAPAVTVTLFSGLAAILVLLPAFAFIHGDATPGSLAWGAGAGVFGGIGALLLYRALAHGPVSVASPILCVTGLALPVIAGIALGERPSLLASAGLVLTPVSIVLLAQVDARWTHEERARVRRVIVPSLVAGFVVGFFLLCLGRIPKGSGLMPLMVARVTGMLVLAAWALARRLPLVPAAGARRMSLGAGALDSAANVGYVIAVQHATLSLVAALVSLAPATSVLLARLWLGERWSAGQRAGLVAALGAGAMISLG